ncbi:hypothetical protein [Sphingobacterium olei]|uniref:hypothetical protein n=1 Tax=Sphingobacterium olei TaxID=2571155 RepID=UPI00138FDE00|nr:hypothetical protein [Sphingobacterium olei]
MKLNEVRISTLGGTFCSVWASITWGGVLETVVLSAIGALVSYGVSGWLGKLRKNE